MRRVFAKSQRVWWLFDEFFASWSYPWVPHLAD
jgi:hypothetical protein